MKLKFELEVDANGKFVSAYVRTGDSDHVAKTVELVKGTCVTDYDPNGNLIGVEFLGSCEIEVEGKV